jgi:hypothetical protein
MEPPTTARRAKRENGGLGEDPPGGTIIYFLTHPSDLVVLSMHYEHVDTSTTYNIRRIRHTKAERSEPRGLGGPDTPG